MRKFVLSLCVVLLLVAAVPMLTACNDKGDSYDFAVGDFGYVANGDGENTVTLAVLVNKQLANAVIPATVSNNGVTYTVTQIGEAVFAPTPDGVTLDEIFHYNSGLDESNDSLLSVAFAANSGVKVINGRAFEKCKKLASVTLPNSLDEIKGFAFYKNESLTSVTLPENIEKIGDYAFEGCINITSLTLLSVDPEKLPTVGKAAFKWFDKSKVEFMGGVETYFVFDDLNITVANQSMLDAFGACATSTEIDLRNWSDYVQYMTLEG